MRHSEKSRSWATILNTECHDLNQTKNRTGVVAGEQLGEPGHVGLGDVSGYWQGQPPFRNLCKRAFGTCIIAQSLRREGELTLILVNQGTGYRTMASVLNSGSARNSLANSGRAACMIVGGLLRQFIDGRGRRASLAPRTTIWDLDDHTLGKHLVLRRYLDAWLPIVLKTYGRALFVDGFAGPGLYKRGEEGSPVIAMNALSEHAHHNVMTGLMDYIFIEEEPRRYEYLQDVIRERRTARCPNSAMSGLTTTPTKMSSRGFWTCSNRRAPFQLSS